MRLRALGAAGLMAGAVAAAGVPALAGWTESGEATVTAGSTGMREPSADVVVDGTTATVTVGPPDGGAPPDWYEVARDGTVICSSRPAVGDTLPGTCDDGELPGAGAVDYVVQAGVGTSWTARTEVSGLVPPPAPTLSLAPDSDSGEVGDLATTDTTPVVLLSAAGGANPYTVTVMVDGQAVGGPVDVGPGGVTDTPVELPALAVGGHQVTAVATWSTTSTPATPLALTVLGTTRVETLSLATAATGGGARGNLKNGDSLTVRFSAPLDPSSVCAAWSPAPDGVGRTVAATVTVRRVAGGAMSELTVAPEADACGGGATLNLGVLTMDAAPTGGGITSRVSSGSLVLDVDHQELVLVIGTGTPTNVWQLEASYTSTFVPSALLVDSQGEPVTNEQITTSTTF